jgi:hypothetical protein
MMTIRGRLLAGLLIAAGGMVGAQGVDHSGTWRLNKEASQIVSGAGLAGLGAGGVPPTLYVAQAANGTAVVGSDINESGAKLYQVTAKGLTLEREGTTEHLSVSADGKTLTVRVTTAAASTTLVYVRKTDVDPCERWPTGCRW